ncbi:MAG: type IV pilin-like G/H family protein [Cyanobacteriota bacterium]|nr:type IV pilin-like G/H family protein [Cyanobacteriota bacterium]
MKRDLQAKFLMHIASKKQDDEGFTLIELLVVIIIIGILAAIALPSLLGQVNKAKQSEARNNVGAMNRAQQAFALEATDFTTSVSELGIGIQKQTANYLYDIKDGPVGGKLLAIVANRATPLTTTKTLKPYGGVVALIEAQVAGGGGTAEALTIATLCEKTSPLAKGTATANTPGNGSFPNPTAANYDAGKEKIKCGNDYKDLGS